MPLTCESIMTSRSTFMKPQVRAKWCVSEGGLEPFAYAQALSAEFAIKGRS
jgi:hypothetical protein